MRSIHIAAVYQGPRNQLRGERALVRPAPGAPGFVRVQFDRMDLTVAGVSMAHGWHLIREEYIRPCDPALSVVSFPSGITREERRAFVKAALRGNRHGRDS